ncbi:MAG: HD domain-containing protein [Hydrogenoanaerobacterium sp.]
MIAREEAIYSKALEYATQKHSGQLRIGGTPYITHPIAVAQLMRESGYGLDYQLTALFHDLLEDTDATEAEIAALSNDEVLAAVLLLTKKKDYDMREYVEAICKNPMAKAVKAADRLHNLQCALNTTQEFKRRYILETVDWYMDFSSEIPKAVKILAQSLETPLTELSFLYEPNLKWKLESE